MKHMCYGKVTNVDMVLEKSALGIFSSILASGVTVHANSGESVKHLLCARLGLDVEYVENRIQTVFLDSSAIDDIATAFLRGDSPVVAVSAAMPGLAGATMRMKGIVSSMRSAISLKPVPPEKSGPPCEVVVKFFNLTAKELAVPVFKRGVHVNAEKISDFLTMHETFLQKGVQNLFINGKESGLEEFAGAVDTEHVFLRINHTQPLSR